MRTVGGAGGVEDDEVSPAAAATPGATLFTSGESACIGHAGSK